MLPKARAQPADNDRQPQGEASTSGRREEAQRQAMTPEGARIIPVPALRPNQDDGGLFDASAVTRAKKDTGGIGEPLLAPMRLVVYHVIF